VHEPLSTMTGEAADAATVTFSIELGSAPTAPVTIPLSSSNPNEGLITSPSSAELVFDSDNWNEPQQVTVKGVDDSDPDGTVGYVLEIGPSESDDAKYEGINPKDLNLQNEDDDPP
jgi:large repetitive protein